MNFQNFTNAEVKGTNPEAEYLPLFPFLLCITGVPKCSGCDKGK